MNTNGQIPREAKTPSCYLENQWDVDLTRGHVKVNHGDWTRKVNHPSQLHCHHGATADSSPIFCRLCSGSPSSFSSVMGGAAAGSLPCDPRAVLVLSVPRREACLAVIWRPARTLGPQCRSGFGRNLATFLAWALLREATARAKLACPEQIW